MNFLFLTMDYPTDDRHTNLYTDLIAELKEQGHKVSVVCPTERRNKRNTGFTVHRSINVLRVKTGNITKTKKIEKGISTLLLENQFINAIKKNLQNEKFDMVLYCTPPITFERVIKYVKETYNAKSYLLLKDIFPQNAIDLEMIKSDSIIHRFFLEKEKKLYSVSDYIGCMSEGNKEYLLEKNPYINTEIVEINPNSIKPSTNCKLDNSSLIRKKYGVSQDAIFMIYGGNLGKPQGIDFLLETIDFIREREELYLLIIGAGTEYETIKKYLEDIEAENVNLLSFIVKEEYQDVVNSADLGLIFLDHRFTIPNIPSRLLGYMDQKKPVLAITDSNTDLKEIIYEAKCGYYTPAGNIEKFSSTIDKIISERYVLKTKGENGRNYLEENFDVKFSCEKILEKLI